MKTQIFKNYSDFLSREDESINGVSTEFAELHPDYEKQNETNTGCWNCSDCSGCSGCSYCSDCSDCSGCSDCYSCYSCSDCFYCSECSDCSDCSGCSDCSDCSGCSDCYSCYSCSDCSDCSYCSYCSRCSGKAGKAGINQKITVPKIENIHQKVFVAASTEDALNMSSWHTCETTHCRAGWVVHLAGEAGSKLENATSTEFAAMMIYRASSEIKVSPTRFYETSEKALADMKRCAELEKQGG